MALDVADYAYVMENGRIVLDGPPARLLAPPGHPRVLPGIRPAPRAGSYRDVKQYRRSRRWYG